MKILIFGLDNSILDGNSRLAKRAVEYGNLVDLYYIIVPSLGCPGMTYSDKVKVYGVRGANKFVILLKIFRLGKKLIRKYDFDVVSVQDQYYLALISYLLARQFKLGLEIQFHGLEKFTGLRKVLAKFIITRADSIRTVSREDEKRANKRI